MTYTPANLTDLLSKIQAVIHDNVEFVTSLDLELGDGDHVYNLQRGLNALIGIAPELAMLDWANAWQKMGMTLMSTVGGASGSLYGTLFIKMAKAATDTNLDSAGFAYVFNEGVAAVKQRGKADLGEKTMLDVLIPVAQSLQKDVESATPFELTLDKVISVAAAGLESTRDMLATKGRASFLGERSKGHLDAGAKTAELMIATIVRHLQAQSTAPA